MAGVTTSLTTFKPASAVTVGPLFVEY